MEKTSGGQEEFGEDVKTIKRIYIWTAVAVVEAKAKINSIAIIQQFLSYWKPEPASLLWCFSAVAIDRTLISWTTQMHITQTTTWVPSGPFGCCACVGVYAFKF